MSDKSEEIIVPKEEAVFWMDKNGRWHNEHGPFEHKKLIAYFHRCIGYDENGYFVSQQREHVQEKVYFHHEDTALFVFDIRTDDAAIHLVLNTGRDMLLDPRALYIRDDSLYLNADGERIKFTERALTSLAKWMSESENGLMLEWNGRSYVIPEAEDG